MKIAAFYYAPLSLEYFNASLAPLSGNVGVVCVAYNHSAQTAVPLEELKKRIQPFASCQILEGRWESDLDCLNQLLPYFLSQSISHLLLLETSEVYSTSELQRIIGFCQAHPSAAQFLIRPHDYWKSPLHRVEPPDTDAPVVLAQLAPQTKFLAARITNQRPVQLIPPEVAQCHRFAFAEPAHSVTDRLAALGLGGKAINAWKKQVWQAWESNSSLRDLHPQQPQRFRQAAPIHPAQLPESLANHPLFLRAVPGAPCMNRPNFSVIVRCHGKQDQVEQFLSNLLSTAPCHLELIFCAPSNGDGAARWLASKPGIVVIQADADEPNRICWQKAAQLAKGKHLLFLHTGLHLAGDWLEGFQAAFDNHTGAEPLIVIPRFLGLELLSQPPALVFEQTRGRHYGQHTLLREIRSAETLDCWATASATWQQRGLAGGIIAGGISVICIEDTVVFAPAAASLPDLPQAPHSTTLEDLPASIVIPAFNKSSYTRACLESIFEHTPPHLFEVIVVDNGSTDDTRDCVSRWGPKVRYLYNYRNLFFAKGCNRGAWAARGKNILLLNNDVVVGPGWLEPLLEVLDQDPRIAIVGNKQLYPASHPVYPNQVWHAGVILTPDNAPTQIYYGFDRDHPLVNRQQDYPGVIGSCFLIRRSVFEELNGLDVEFINGHEETDLCLRAGEKGYRVVYTPRSEIIHHASVSEGRFDRELHNLLHFQAKWADKINPTEPACYEQAGLIPAHDARPPLRIGVVAPCRQEHRLAKGVDALVRSASPESCAVLAECAIQGRLPGADPANVLRAWNHLSNWHYPMGRLACSLDFDLIHLHWDSKLCGEGFEAWLGQLKRGGKKIAVSLQEVRPEAAIWPALIQAADALIASSSAQLREMLAAGCPAAKTGCLEPGLAVLEPIPRRDARQKLNIAENAKVVVSFGYLSERKGTVELIAAFAALRPNSETYLYILGQPDRLASNSKDYLANCRARAKRLGIGQQVHFVEKYLGEEELRQYLAAADVVALPYVFDQYYWSHAAAEALASGCAVIASPAKAFLPFGDAIFRISPHISLSRAIRELLNDSALAEQFREKARAFARGRSFSEYNQAAWKLYQSIASSAPGLSFPRPAQKVEPCANTSPGAGRPCVVWEGPQMVNHSLALVNRELELALIEKQRIHLSIHPVCPDNFKACLPANKRVLENFYGKPLPGAAEIHVRHQWPPNWNPPAEGRWVVIQPWEYGSLPCQWIDAINAAVDEVWAPTRFVRDLYVASGISPERVEVVPNGVDVNFFKPGLKPFPLASKKAFRFLFLGGTIPRKGADILLKAYQQAFSAADDVLLVIKDMGTHGIYQGQTMEERIKQLQAEASSPSILYLPEDLSENQIASLYNACHCLVHPYRGEGLGLPVLEAMACALPVIVTAGGATDDFVDDESGYQVPAQRQVFGNREISGLKTTGDLWMLEPDADALAGQMRWVREHPEAAKETGQKARKKVEEGWTWKHAAKKALLRIEALRKTPIYRHLEKFDIVALLRFEPSQARGDEAALYASTINSLQKNSYARMKLLVQPASASPDLIRQLTAIDGVEVLNTTDFPAVLTHIFERFSASYLAVIQSPARFSKQWFGQLALIGGNAPGASKILVPSTDRAGSSCFVQFDGADDELSFQRFCRQLWRTNRGQFKTGAELPSDLACLSWNCLRQTSPGCTSPHTWYEHLMQHDASIIQALDTFVSIKCCSRGR